MFSELKIGINSLIRAHINKQVIVGFKLFFRNTAPYHRRLAVDIHEASNI